MSTQTKETPRRLVIKVGGARGIGGGDLLDDLARHSADAILVHGGSEPTTRLQEQLGEPARFLTSPDGRTSRRTDRRDLEAFTMATGLLNRTYVEALTQRGVAAFGLSGLDGAFVRGRRKSTVRERVDQRVRLVRDQWTGRAEQVDPELLELLLGAGRTPVLAPVIASERGEMLNTDADGLAAKLASALDAELLVLLTNVPGVLERPPTGDARSDEGSRIDWVPTDEIDALAEVAAGRMRTKVLAARAALEAGVRTVVIADARRARPVSDALQGLGTVIGEPLDSAPVPGNRPIDAPQHDAGFSGWRKLDLVRGSGAFVWDRAGRRYLDATAMYGTASLGHAHPALATRVGSQARRLISCFASYGNDARDELFARLARLLAPLDRFFLCNSGTEAVEAAIKVARATTGRRRIVAVEGGFHGRTYGALSATHRTSHREAFDPLVPEFVHIPFDDVEALRSVLDEEVALFLVEVIQGEGGVRALDPGFLKEAQDLCRRHGTLLGIDEVQTGFGRTGQWFSYRSLGLDPDLVCLAKGIAGGLPLGALAMRAESARLPVGAHGSTFGGNPLCCAAAIETIDAIERDGLVERAAELGRGFREHLEPRLQEASVFRALRVYGLMMGIDLRVRSAPYQKRLQEAGFLVLGAGPKTLRLLPPLTIEPDALDALADALVAELRS